MPFTFAHPAAVVPLLRPLGRWAVLSALVIGSIVPDFSYFVPFPVARWRTHDLLGLFWFCLPVGAATYAIFHGVLAAPVIDLLPAALRTRCRAVAAARIPPALSAIALSLGIGAATHIAWDAFTHAGAPIVRVSRALRFPLGTISGYPVSVFTIFQHLSTLVGILLIVLWVQRWQRSAPPSTTAPRFSLGSAARVAAIAGIVVLALLLWIASDRVRPMHEPTLRGLQIFLRRAVPVGITALALSIGAYAAAWHGLARLAATRLSPGAPSDPRVESTRRL